MKTIAIAFKDLLRYFRSTFAVGMMIIAPLMITGLIYFAFSGVFQSSETAAYTLPVIRLQVVNLDRGVHAAPQKAGDLLVNMLTSEDVKEVFAVTETSDVAGAKDAVDHQEAALAIIIPENFSQAAYSGDEPAQVTFYQDPTLSFGPGITREIVSQFLDALVGTQMAVTVTQDQLAARDLTLNAATVNEIQNSYSQWVRSTASDKEWNLPVVQRVPNKATPKSVGDHRTTLMGPVMAGMLIFFIFFTGANASMSILKEQEEGTLARQFTTPTALAAILGGKFLAVWILLIIQSLVLIAASGVLFQIDWGNPLTLAAALTGMVAVAAGFGIFLISLAKSQRQAGVMVGGVLTITSMLGGLFSTGLSQMPSFLDQISLAMPQGWALKGIQVALAGSAPQQVILPALVMLVMGGVLFALGAWRWNARFA